MSRSGGWWMVVMAVMALAPAVAVSARAAGSIVLPRPGQVGVGAQGGWGTLLKSGDLGGTFGNGPTLAFRLRYRMRYERALGLSFEGERFEIRVPEARDPADSLLSGRTHVNAILSGLEFYQLFGTRTRTTKMVMVGAGLVQISGRTLNNETFFPGDGSYVSVGAGVERFLIRSWALDFSTRYVALFLPDDRNHDLQVALGLIFYASY
ncbi:MAG: hypothetical protein AAB290_06985 [Candidatus Eisenbacteria bacterium]